MWNRYVFAALVVAFLGVQTADGQGAISVNFTTTGRHRLWTKPVEFDIPTPVGITNWLGSASAQTAAHGGTAAFKKNTGIKLTYTKLTPVAAGVFTSGSVHSGVASSPGDGCKSVNGLSVLLADGYMRGTLLKQGVLSSESRFGVDINVVQHEDDTGWASFIGQTIDPFPFGSDGFIPIHDRMDFSFELPPSQSLPRVLESGSWKAEYTALVKDIATYGIDEFYGSQPEPLYRVSFGANVSGPWADVELFSPLGLPTYFDRSAEEMENSLVQGLNSGGWDSDLPILSGRFDFAGQQAPNNLTVGYLSEAEAALALPPVPEPGSMVAVGMGLAMAAARRRRR